MKKQLPIYFALLLVFFSSCVTVNQTEIGVKRRAGKLADKTLESGMYTVGMFTRIIKVPISTVNLAINADLPTQEGLTVQTEMSILYNL